MRFEFHVTDPRAQELVAGCATKLQESGLQALTVDKPLVASPVPASLGGLLSLVGPAGNHRFVFDVKPAIHVLNLPRILEELARAATESGAKPVLITTYVNENLGAVLRRAGINYLDVAGNLFLHDPPLLIWFRGNRPPRPPEQPARSFYAAGLQVVSLLLAQPQAVNWPVRAIAQQAGVAVGSIPRIMQELRAAGHLRLLGPRQRVLQNRRDLFDRWEFSYLQRLRPRLAITTCRLVQPDSLTTLHERLKGRQEILVGGELAAGLQTEHLRPAKATLHIRADLVAGSYLLQLGLMPDQRGNIQIVRHFGDGDIWLWPNGNGWRIMHPLLVHAELLYNEADDRLRETALMLHRRYLAPLIDHG